MDGHNVTASLDEVWNSLLGLHNHQLQARRQACRSLGRQYNCRRSQIWKISQNAYSARSMCVLLCLSFHGLGFRQKLHSKRHVLRPLQLQRLIGQQPTSAGCPMSSLKWWRLMKLPNCQLPSNTYYLSNQKSCKEHSLAVIESNWATIRLT